MLNNSTWERLPLSPRQWPPSAFPILGSIGLFLFLIGVVIVVSVGIVLAMVPAARGVPSDRLSWPLVVVECSWRVIAIALLAWVLPKLARRPLGALGFAVFSRREALAGFVGFVLMWLSVAIVAAIQNAIVPSHQQQLAVKMFETAGGGPLTDAFVFLTVVLAPISEEFIFRGFIFNALWRHMRFWPAAIVSGLIFGGVHLGWPELLPLTAGGIVLAALYARTSSIWASMIAHALFNSTTVILVMAFHIKA